MIRASILVKYIFYYFFAIRDTKRDQMGARRCQRWFPFEHSPTGLSDHGYLLASRNSYLAFLFLLIPVRKNRLMQAHVIRFSGMLIIMDPLSRREQVAIMLQFESNNSQIKISLDARKFTFCNDSSITNVMGQQKHLSVS